MQLRIGNSGPVAGFMALIAVPDPITVGAAGHVDVTIALPGAVLGDSPMLNLLPSTGTEGLIVSGASVATAGSIFVRIVNPSAAGIGPVTPQFLCLLMHTVALGAS